MTPEGPPIRVTVWNEFLHRDDPLVQSVYPDGMHQELARAIRERCPRPVKVRTAVLDDPECGLGDDVLEATDVLLWWGHLAHDRVPDELAARVHARVLRGMGFVALHSGVRSKPFRMLMGTTCTFRWRHGDDRELVWVVAPGHAIARGLPPVVQIPAHEMYGEFFDIPAPDEIVFISSFTGGEVVRSGSCFSRGDGRVFAFTPGHEKNPVYHQPEIRQIVANAVAWANADRPADEGPRVTIESPPGWFEQDR